MTLTHLTTNFFGVAFPRRVSKSKLLYREYYCCTIIVLTNNIGRRIQMWVLSVTHLSVLAFLVAQQVPVSSAFMMPSQYTPPPRRLLSSRSVALSLSESSSLTSKEAHVLEVFERFSSKRGSACIDSPSSLYEVLNCLDFEATEEEAEALFRYLGESGQGKLFFNDFLPWYQDASDAATAVAESFQSLLVGRRTIEQFDQTSVDDDVLERAVMCAIAAPNRSMSEPWRFIRVGKATVAKFAELKAKIQKNMETDEGASSVYDWTQVPGWCVVTTKINPDDPEAEMEDFKSVSCAIQNFMLSMWSEGVGTKWTSGPVQKTQEFAELCGVDTSKERVVGCIWYGYATGGARYADPRRRKKDVKDVLGHLP